MFGNLEASLSKAYKVNLYNILIKNTFYNWQFKFLILSHEDPNWQRLKKWGNWGTGELGSQKVYWPAESLGA